MNRIHFDILVEISTPLWVPFFVALLMGEIAMDLVGDLLREARAPGSAFQPGVRP